MSRVCLVLVLFLFVGLTPVDAPGCGPTFQSAAFEPNASPGVSQKEFSSGKVGVVRGSLWLEYLIPAWRHLNGRPVTVAKPRAPESDKTAWERWSEARAQVASTSLPSMINTYRDVPGEPYESYPNCLDDSFQNAARTLKERIAAFGPKHPGVIAWVQAQDQVFQNCSDGTAVPRSAEPSLPAVLKADRAYQIASAHFYAGRFDEARAQFLRIASDASSQYRHLAPYLGARCLLRQGTLQKPQNGALIAKAEVELQRIGHSRTDEPVRRAAALLAEHAGAKLRPADRMAQLANNLADPTQDANFATNLHDFDLLWVTRGPSPAASAKSELYDWLMTMRGKLPVDPSRPLSSPAWMIAALEQAKPGPNNNSLLAAAQSLKPESPAYPTVAFHVVRLTAGTLKQPERRKQLDDVIANLRRTQPRSVLNPFLEQRLLLAATFDEFLDSAPRAPIGITDDLDPTASDWPAELPALLFDTDASASFNTGLPLGRWIQALDSPKLPEHLRERLVQAGWVRAVLLGNEVAAKSLAPKLRAMSPELKDLLTDDSRFTAIYALLNAPGLQPYLQAGLGRLNWENKTMAPTTLDEFRRNWWCAAGPSRLDADGNAKAIAPPDLTFLGAAEKISATREAEVIRSGGAGPNFLGRLATDYITKNPEDPRGARTLHLVVRATRYSCTDANTATVSKRAFQLLHKLYPRSDWAKKTPYWFGG